MTPLELHIKLDVAYSQLNSNKNLQVLPEVKDLILNQAVFEYIDSIINPMRNKKYIQFENAIKNDSIQRLITEKLIPVNISNVNPTINQLYSFIDVGERGVYNGFSFTPFDYLYFGKALLYYDGEYCQSEVNREMATLRDTYYVFKANLFTSETTLTYTNGDTIVNLLEGFEYIENYNKDKHYFTLINHILDSFKNYIVNSEDENHFKLINELEIGYEKLDDVYVTNCIIFKTNRGVVNSNIVDRYNVNRNRYGSSDRLNIYHVSSLYREGSTNHNFLGHLIHEVMNGVLINQLFDIFDLKLLSTWDSTITGSEESSISDTLEAMNNPINQLVTPDYTFHRATIDSVSREHRYIFKQISNNLDKSLRNVDRAGGEYTFEKIIQYEPNFSTMNHTPCDLQSSVDLLSGIKNHYLNKNIINHVPISIKENTIFIKNLLPKYTPKYIRLNYVRKPLTINYKLNQMCEINNYDEIVSIASRIMTSYVNNQNEYNIKKTENNE